jgi:putative oxidoreductase
LFSSLDRFQPFGALVMRLVLGAIMVAHGYQKVIPHGALDNFTRMVAHLGLPSWLAFMAAFTEFFGGTLLIVGLLTRIVGCFMTIEMAVAIYKVHLHNGILASNGYALPLACLAIALMLVFTGSGALALDDLLGKGSMGARARAR